MFRVLWFKENAIILLHKNAVEEWQMTIVPLGSASSSFMLTATIPYHLKSVSEEEHDLAEKLSRSFYEDDFIDRSRHNP